MVIQMLTNSQNLASHDPYGFLMAIMAISIVLLVLGFLFIVFKVLPTLISKRFRMFFGLSPRRVRPQDEHSGEVNAAIAMAIHLHNEELHDIERTILTIHRMENRYSPWSSKIYGLRKAPR